MFRAMMQLSFANRSICTSSIWAILLLLSYGYAEIFDFTKCDITENFKSELVSASFKNLDAGVGCETNATTPAGQEVHVIAVNPPSESDDEGMINIKLSIHSRRQANLEEMAGADFHEDVGPVNFVLHSTRPAKWKVEMHGINSQDKHIFMVSKESSVRFQRKRMKMITKVRKRVMPFSASKSTIFLWAQRRFGAVTSYSETPELNVKFYIGRDTNASLVCDLNVLHSSLRIFSYRETITPMTGCTSKRRNTHVRTKPVYILELLEPPQPSPGVTGVDLEILPYYSKVRSTRGQQNKEEEDDEWNFYLVVKSPPGLRWMLHSPKISGWVDIVADAGADVKVTGVKISTVALRADEMKATGLQLVEWTQDYIAPVQMYAGIRAANTIQLRVPPLEKSFVSPRDRTAATNEVDHKSKTQREGKWGSEIDLGKTDKYMNLSSRIQTTCNNNMMEIVISKKFFQLTGLDKSKISLRDPSCQPTFKTEEHIIFCTELTQCGTHSLSVDDKISYTNAVIIQTTPDLVSSILQDELGSGFFEEEAGSATNDLSLHVDDEDFHSNPVKLPVECKLPATTEGKPKSEGSVSQFCKNGEPPAASTCSMTIYSTPFFLRPRVQFPITVAKDSELYIKASTTNQDTTLVADSCWFSTSAVPHDKSARTHEIIAQGCSKDDSVNWMDDSTNYKNVPFTKLRVKVRDMFNGQSPIYLHCNFRTCQQANDIHAEKCSTDGYVRCHQSTYPAANNPGSAAVPDCGPLTLGPLDLTDKEIHMKPASGGPGTKTVNSNEERNNSQQQQRVIIEGLDSATVIGIAFAAFAIGILLTGALWFIHSHTGPMKQAAATRREADVSGDVTPNSSSPMTA